ncbi:prenyltransferase [Candidatus Latescibacterota bacterium]
MKKFSVMHTWLKEIRANFLVLPVALVMIGGAAAYCEDIFNPVLFIITLFGVTAAHISVNLFNEYSDWRTGIDERTKRTPFSGGSGNLQKGLIAPGHVRTAAWVTLALAFFTGAGLLAVSGWQVMIFMALGGVTVVIYTDYLTKCMLGEIAAGFALGSLVVLGAYYVQAGSLTSTIVWASIAPGLLTMLLLLLNEFPDAEADKVGGRRHLVIVLGKQRAAVVYSILLASVYIILVLGVITGELPGTVLISLATIPFAAGAMYHALRYANDSERIVTALGLNVIVVLATDFLIALGFLLG